MTLYTCLNLSDRLKIDWSTEICIDKEVKMIDGTSACLEPGDTLIVKDLMYGMMLPSGNDAAY